MSDLKKDNPDLDKCLAAAKEFHGEICGGIHMGTRMAIQGMRAIGIHDPDGEDRKDLVVFVEIDRWLMSIAKYRFDTTTSDIMLALIDFLSKLLPIRKVRDRKRGQTRTENGDRPRFSLVSRTLPPPDHHAPPSAPDASRYAAACHSARQQSPGLFFRR